MLWRAKRILLPLLLPLLLLPLEPCIQPQAGDWVYFRDSYMDTDPAEGVTDSAAAVWNMG